MTRPVNKSAEGWVAHHERNSTRKYASRQQAAKATATATATATGNPAGNKPARTGIR